jgi:Tol biopolymer transport system component
VPVLGGTPRPVGDLRAHDAGWSPDGRTIAYTIGVDLFVAAADGSGARKIWTAGGSASSPVWAPDGRRLRLTVADPGAIRHSLWEVEADGRNPHVLLPSFEAPTSCGRWSPDGRHFVFVGGSGDGRGDLWLRAERVGWLSNESSSPVRLTQGPLSYWWPVWSRDGGRIFADGHKASGELVRCPTGSSECSPFLGGIDAEGVSFSPDGKWVAYVLADESLWRGRSDGTERLQLTFSPVAAALPRWSPDGTRILFSRVDGGKPRVQLVPAGGGPTQDAVPGDAGRQLDGSWAPDGHRLAYGRDITGRPEDREITIQIADLATGQVTVVPGSKGLFSPRWSPDGRRLAAASHDTLRLLLYDFASQQWRVLLNGGASYPVWDRDGEHVYVDAGVARIRLRVTDGRQETVTTYPGLRRRDRRFGYWAGQAPDGSTLTLRRTSLDELFAFELDMP